MAATRCKHGALVSIAPLPGRQAELDLLTSLINGIEPGGGR
jgi:hypothetical protein